MDTTDSGPDSFPADVEETPNVTHFGAGERITVIIDGEHYHRSADQVDISEVIEAAERAEREPTESNIQSLRTKLNPFAREMKLGILERNGRGQYFLPGTHTPLPKPMVHHIRELQEKDLEGRIDAAVNFWKRSLLNPNPTAREGFFAYCREYGITFTSQGYAVLYKAVDRNEGYDLDDDLVNFIGRKYLQVRRQAQQPSDYYVLERSDAEGVDDRRSYQLYNAEQWDSHPNLTDGIGDDRTQVTNLGTLEEMFEKARSTTAGQFQPSMTGDKYKYGQNISLGEPVTMPREKCDPNINKSCSEGLHVGSYDYVKRFGRNMDTILATYVDPKDIVALPKHDNSKLRTCRYTPYAIMNRDEDGHWEEIEQTVVDDETIIGKDDLLERFDELASTPEDQRSEIHEDQLEIMEERLQQLGVDTKGRVSWQTTSDVEDVVEDSSDSPGGYPHTQPDESRHEDPQDQVQEDQGGTTIYNPGTRRDPDLGPSSEPNPGDPSDRPDDV